MFSYKRQYSCRYWIWHWQNGVHVMYNMKGIRYRLVIVHKINEHFAQYMYMHIFVLNPVKFYWMVVDLCALHINHVKWKQDLIGKYKLSICTCMWSFTLIISIYNCHYHCTVILCYICTCWEKYFGACKFRLYFFVLSCNYLQF